MARILEGIGIFYLGFLVGYLAKAWLTYRFSDYSGVMIVSKDEGKTLYSLVLEDYPEKLEFKKHVHLRVVESEENPDRE